MRALYDVPAPAKLNLFLHILGRRPADGYHLLQSAFVLIDWCDTLHFERLSASAQISRQDLNASLPAQDLIVRAAQALQAATGCTQGAHITISKHIPAQAGLGGGSSDAASTLLALNRLWGLDLTRAELARIGLGLGADVPFFILGRHAWVEGVGERLQALPEGETAEFVVIKPQAGLSTQAIFSAPDLQRATKPAIVADFVAKRFEFGQNDLQPVAQRLCPEIGQALEFLAAHGLQGRMTGSGSSVFAPISATMRNSLQSALFSELPAQAKTREWQFRFCKMLNTHPLLGWVSGDI